MPPAMQTQSRTQDEAAVARPGARDQPDPDCDFYHEYRGVSHCLCRENESVSEAVGHVLGALHDCGFHFVSVAACLDHDFDECRDFDGGASESGFENDALGFDAFVVDCGHHHERARNYPQMNYVRAVFYLLMAMVTGAAWAVRTTGTCWTCAYVPGGDTRSLCALGTVC